MRRFELIDASSSKFWEIAVQDADVTVRFGRIGSGGQSKTKTFASAAAALAEQAKLIREKTGKGYQEIVEGNAPAPSARVKPAAVKTPASAATAPAPTIDPIEAPPAIAAIVWPTGGLAWDDKLRVQLPIVRGVQVPALIRAFPEDMPPPFHPQGQFALHEAQAFLQEVAKTGAIASPVLWDEDAVRAQLSPERLQQADLAHWREILLQCAVSQSHYRRHDKDPFDWLMAAAMAQQPLAFVLHAVLDAARTGFNAIQLGRSGIYCGWAEPGFQRLRHALAAADADEWQAAYQFAQDFRGQTGLTDGILSYLFPENSAWADAAAADQHWYGWVLSRLGLETTAQSVASACDYWQRNATSIAPLPMALLQIHLHGVAALPLLEKMLDGVQTSEAKASVAKLLGKLHCPALLPALLARFELKEVRAVLDKLAVQWPAAVLHGAIERSGDAPTVATWALQLALRQPDSVEAALAACDRKIAERFAARLAAFNQPVAEAAAEALPPLLRNPPWLTRQRAATLPTLALTPQDPPEAMVWPDGLQAHWGGYQLSDWFEFSRYNKSNLPDPAMTAEQFYLRRLWVSPAAHAKVLAGEPMQAEDVEKFYYHSNTHYHDIEPTALLRLPPAVALTVWNSIPPTLWDSRNELPAIFAALFARHGIACLPGLLNYFTAHPGQHLALALPFRAARLAPLVAHALHSIKKSRVAAEQWLRAHPETAAIALIPPAFGSVRTARDPALTALRWLAHNGHAETLRTAAVGYGEAATAALTQWLALDPALIVPATLPKLPMFFSAAACRRPQLRQGGALPLSAIEHLGTMLAISQLHQPYAGLASVTAACTADSLADFAWDVFEAWRGAGAPSKDNWAFAALGLLGNDDTARRLGPLIRAWPGEGASAHAKTGLEILALIGSDVALMNLNGIANNAAFKGLQKNAKEKITQIAEARHLSEDDLADRLVPDLGLDASGRTVLDFGPRQFVIGFDESLNPFVKDHDGSRLRSLPKPNKFDDAQRAAAAVARYKALKQDVKALANLHLIRRLETAMCQRRRWDEASFRLCFADHRLMRHLAQLLLWGVYRDGELLAAFRIAEDATFADRDDSLYTLPADARIGLVHPLDMADDLKRDCGQIFADYEIMQPFQQLARGVFSLTEAEWQSGNIDRFTGKRVSSGSILNLLKRGWSCGGGNPFNKTLAAGVELALDMTPGIYLEYGGGNQEPVQTLSDLRLHRRGSSTLAEVDAFAVSEALRDVDVLSALA